MSFDGVMSQKENARGTRQSHQDRQQGSFRWELVVDTSVGGPLQVFTLCLTLVVRVSLRQMDPESELAGCYAPC